MKKYLLIALIGLFAASCSDSVMDDINKDNEHPGADVVSAKFQITDAITATAYTTLSGSYAWYVSSLTEQLFGCGGNQLMNYELRKRMETTASTTFNNEWNGTYLNCMNLTQIIAKCSEGGINAGQSDLKGMAETLLALNFGVLTDLHGDIPCSESVKGAANLQPKLDGQQAVYTYVFELLDNAIADLTTASTEGMSNAGDQDFLFANNNNKWLGLAHALKARYLLHTAVKDNTAYDSVLTEVEAAIATGFDGAELAIFNGVDCDNSWAAYFWSRYYTASSKTVCDLMDARNDARLGVYSVDFFETGKEYGTPGNEADAQSIQSLSAPAWLDNGAAKEHVFSKSELYFIKAEIQARKGADASEAFATAIKASFADYGDAAGENFEDVDAYIAALPVTLSEILVQKYIAQTRDEQIETYNDIRRIAALGETYPVTLMNAKNKSSLGNEWPYLLPYGNSDVTSNRNVKEAYGDGTYVFSKKGYYFEGN